METLRGVKSVILILTTGCNLRCSYCYQNLRTRRVMNWSTIRAAVELLLASHQKRLRLMFLGGEPLLEFSSLRRAIEYAELRRARRHVRYTLSTNGTLMSSEVAEFLDQAGVEVQLSFDGVAPAQDYRAAGSFGRLDRLLVRLRHRHPTFFRERLTVNITLTRPALPHLADSVDYLLARGCQRISITPVITACGDPGGDLIGQLGRQFTRIYRACRRHFEETGRVPLAVFASETRRNPAGAAGVAMCSAARGTNLTVDVDGQIFGCAVVAESVQDLQNSLFAALRGSMRLGDLKSPRLAADYRRFIENLQGSKALNHKEDKYSAFGRCRDCRFLENCTVCPVSSVHIPGNKNPHRVSDFACAFHKVALSYASRLRAEYDGELRCDPDAIISRMESFVASRTPSRARPLQSLGQVPNTDGGPRTR